MESTSVKKDHWEKVYETKTDEQVSWYEEKPATSLELIESLELHKDAATIDIGGGNSNLAPELLKKGFSRLSVLDISEKALRRTRQKLGNKADEINWIVSDILEFEPEESYDLWHDRATFHFLTRNEDIEKYVRTAVNSIKSGGYLLLATFSITGPEKCSGLPITQYSEAKLRSLFGKEFSLIQSFEETHRTPFGTTQNFLYSLFQKQ